MTSCSLLLYAPPLITILMAFASNSVDNLWIENHSLYTETWQATEKVL